MLSWAVPVFTSLFQAMNKLASERSAIPESQLRVLYADHVGFIGGAEISLLGMVKAFRASKLVEPLVVLPETGPLFNALREANIETIVVPMIPLNLTKNPFVFVAYIIHIASYIRNVQRILRERQIDIVHANSIKAGILVGIAAKLTKVPLIWHIRDYYPDGYLKRLIRIWARLFATHIIVISQRVAQMFTGFTNQTIVYNGVDLTLYSAEDLNRGRVAIYDELELDSSSIIIGTIGQLSPWKNQEDFILAAEKIYREKSHVHFLIVGDSYHMHQSDYKEKLRELARTHLPAHAISFLGWRQDVTNVIGALSILIHLAEDEPFGRVVIEAMAGYTPVICTNSGGLPEIIEDGVTGLLVPVNDPDTVAIAALQLIRDKALCERMGRLGHKRAVESFSIQSNMMQVYETYTLVAVPKNDQ